MQNLFKEATAILCAAALFLFSGVSYAQEAETEEGAEETAEEAATEEAPEGTSEKAATEETSKVAEEETTEETPTEETPGEEAAPEKTPDEDVGLDEPFVPGAGLTEEDDNYEYEDELDKALDELPDGKPFAKGDMELGIGLGGWGSGDYFSLMIGGTFAYYVINRLAPGIQIDYQTIFGDFEYPQSLTTMPFLKFVLIRSTKFAPYLIVAGGREFQWGGTDDPTKGYKAVGSWIVGGGAGVHIGIGAHLAIKLQMLALHYTFDEKVRLVGEKDAVDSKLFFPVISLGMAIMF